MLVMAISNFHTHPQEAVAVVALDDVAQGVAADLRVAAHDRHLLGSERPLLAQDGVRDAHLADVVEGARLVELLDELVSDLSQGRLAAGGLGQQAAVFGHALQVAARLVVARLGQAGESEQGDVARLADLHRLLAHHALEALAVLLVLADQTGPLDRPLHRGDQVVHLERLGDVVVGPGAHALADGVHLLDAGHHHHLDGLIEGLQPLQQLDPGEARRLDVRAPQRRPGLLRGAGARPRRGGAPRRRPSQDGNPEEAERGGMPTEPGWRAHQRRLRRVLSYCAKLAPGLQTAKPGSLLWDRSRRGPSPAWPGRRNGHLDRALSSATSLKSRLDGDYYVADCTGKSAVCKDRATFSSPSAPPPSGYTRSPPASGSRSGRGRPPPCRCAPRRPPPSSGARGCGCRSRSGRCSSRGGRGWGCRGCRARWWRGTSRNTRRAGRPRPPPSR